MSGAARPPDGLVERLARLRVWPVRWMCGPRDYLRFVSSVVFPVEPFLARDPAIPKLIVGHVKRSRAEPFVAGDCARASTHPRIKDVRRMHRGQLRAHRYQAACYPFAVRMRCALRSTAWSSARMRI